jgi:hypothetical protein
MTYEFGSVQGRIGLWSITNEPASHVHDKDDASTPYRLHKKALRISLGLTEQKGRAIIESGELELESSLSSYHTPSPSLDPVPSLHSYHTTSPQQWPLLVPL